MIGSSRAQRGSRRTCSARNGANRQMAAAKTRDMDREIRSPVRKMAFPCRTLAATKREMAVWMDPAQRAKQTPKMGWIML